MGRAFRTYQKCAGWIMSEVVFLTAQNDQDVLDTQVSMCRNIGSGLVAQECGGLRAGRLAVERVEGNTRVKRLPILLRDLCNGIFSQQVLGSGLFHRCSSPESTS